MSNIKETLEALKDPCKTADLLMKIVVIPKAAKMIKAKIPQGKINQSSILNYLPTLISSIDFSSDLNVYKKSSYYVPDGKSYKFANAILNRT